MAVTYFGRTAVPADNGSNATATVTVTPPASMLAGDIVYAVFCTRSVSSTLSITTTGGQTWVTTNTQVTQGTTISKTFSCIYNGTWSADPVFDCSDTGLTASSVAMVVFRPGSGSAASDVADTSVGFGNPLTPFDVTITGITVADNAVAIAAWTSKDDNEWALQTSGWLNPSSEAQWRNTAGSDVSISIGYQIFATGQATGDVTNRQTTLGGDEGMKSIVSFKEVGGGGGGSGPFPLAGARGSLAGARGLAA